VSIVQLPKPRCESQCKVIVEGLKSVKSRAQILGEVVIWVEFELMFCGSGGSDVRSVIVKGRSSPKHDEIANWRDRSNQW